MIWISVDGRVFELHEISDEHLKNIIRHCKLYNYSLSTIETLEQEALRRGFKEKFVGQAIPWRDKDGKLKTYDPVKNLTGYIEVTEN